MLDNSAVTKAVFSRLERATAAVHPEHLSQGREQNPLSSMHWTLENHGAGYRITMMRSGIVVAQKTIDPNDFMMTLPNGKKAVIPQEQFGPIVEAMFEKVPKKAA